MAVERWRCSCGTKLDVVSDSYSVAVGVVELCRREHEAQGHHEVTHAEWRRIKDAQRRREAAYRF